MENLHKKPNRLINEKSPYLRQHAYNPVDWYPWGEEAFEKAKRENKPVFLSIGYSTCHWCHVMEKESFEDVEIAEILNKNYVSIKVDREERPDVDSIYMKVCILLTGHGGWPLTIIMTPDKKPFFAGTYFPKESSFGRIGLKDILLHLSDLWKKEKEALVNRADKIVEYVEEDIREKEKKHIEPEKVIKRAYLELKNRFDSKNGGFGEKPKFPSPHNLLFLLRYWKRTGDKEALDMVKFTLKKMRLGGIYDHVGFGFHRYSTDKKWLLPHFEKMLYDQAMLIMAYTETYKATGETFYREVAEEIAEYVIRDMSSHEGGFYSAEDADSEGEEGKFYVWSYNELKEILKEDFKLFKLIFPVSEEGNYREEATGELTGKNILFMKEDLEEISKKTGIGLEELKNKLEHMRKKLFEYREKRVHPLKDKKILTDWNGLMIAALSILYRFTGEDKYLTSAKRASDFLLETMKKEDGTLYHRYMDGEKKFEGTIDDYSFFIWGLFELYQSTFEEKYLFEAYGLFNTLFKHFWDVENGGFYMTADYVKDLTIRPQEIYDGAIPSGNSVALYNIVRISRILGDENLTKKAEEIVEAFSKEISLLPSAYTMFVSGIDLLANGTKEVIIVGDKKESESLIKEIYRDYNPFLLAALKTKESKLGCISEFIKRLERKDGKPTVYICENFTCKQPITDIKELTPILKE